MIEQRFFESEDYCKRLLARNETINLNRQIAAIAQNAGYDFRDLHHELISTFYGKDYTKFISIYISRKASPINGFSEKTLKLYNEFLNDIITSYIKGDDLSQLIAVKGKLIRAKAEKTFAQPQLFGNNMCPILPRTISGAMIKKAVAVINKAQVQSSNTTANVLNTTTKKHSSKVKHANRPAKVQAADVVAKVVLEPMKETPALKQSITAAQPQEPIITPVISETLNTPKSFAPLGRVDLPLYQKEAKENLEIYGETYKDENPNLFNYERFLPPEERSAWYGLQQTLGIIEKHKDTLVLLQTEKAKDEAHLSELNKQIHQERDEYKISHFLQAGEHANNIETLSAEKEELETEIKLSDFAIEQEKQTLLNLEKEVNEFNRPSNQIKILRQDVEHYKSKINEAYEQKNECDAQIKQHIRTLPEDREELLYEYINSKECKDLDAIQQNCNHRIATYYDRIESTYAAIDELKKTEVEESLNPEK